jgi:hypothetical protein
MWIARLTDSQRDALKALIAAQGEVGPSLSGAYEALDLSRWDELPEAELPWDRVAELAKTQGCGEADVVWDLASGMKVPHASSGKRSATARRAARASARTAAPPRKKAA